MKPVSAEVPSAEDPVSPLTAKPVVNVRGLRYRYPDGTQALDGVDFQLRYGECVAVFGPNGSGKTTFILHLNGLLRGEGSLEVCGVRLDGAAGADALAQVRARVGLVFQNSDEQLFMPTVSSRTSHSGRRIWDYRLTKLRSERARRWIRSG